MGEPRLVEQTTHGPRYRARISRRCEPQAGATRHLKIELMAEDLARVLVAEFGAELKSVGDPARAAYERSYLKSELEHYGVRVPAMRAATRKLLRRVPHERSPTLALAEELWKTGVHELRMAAVEVLSERAELLLASDLALLERLLRDARTWALIDGLAPQVVGPLVERHPELAATLARWASDPDFWLRRSALLAYLLPMRRGEPVFAEFAALADPLLENREFFIRKAIGWVLRERSKKRPNEVFEWLQPRRHRASGLTLREAGKYLTEQQRAVLATPT